MSSIAARTTRDSRGGPWRPKWQAGTSLVQSITDALGRQTTFTYDTKGNMTSVTRLAGTPQVLTTSLTWEAP